ncbi:unnamed protein product [Caenorhabditis bovis]|uniref:CCA tRNA nucleotidyltransferase 1, mitochondrial n=1 Tax=Caenorhabditis bovis TaxID=2654633 RepID=A0A8S1EGN7_9PELO|nr:unnamed protein product [Caenorhabditis bovis]
METITPVTMRIESDAFRGLFTPQLEKLRKMFEKRNFEIRIAGGAVRDILMGIVPADVDFASTATPTEMKEMFESENIRMLHKRGEEHGTITCRIDDAENFEITTLRVDVVCDGRRATVEYTKNWQLDANRRDLTINSLFLDLDGTVVDYFGGIRDIRTRRVAFVGDARQRIQEDYLRILRYFRFFGRISNTTEHEPDTLSAINENKDGMKGLSAERVWTELKKIVVGRMAPEVVKTMIENCALNAYLGLPVKCNIQRFKQVYNRFHGKLEPMTMIACLCERIEEIEDFHAMTKLSNQERLLGEFLLAERGEAMRNLENSKYWTDRIVELEVRPGHDPDISRLRQRTIQLAMSVQAPDEVLQLVETYKTPIFGVSGKDLMEAGVKKGPNVRNILHYLFDIWKKSNYEMGKRELMERANDENIPQIARKRSKTPPKKRKC